MGRNPRPRLSVGERMTLSDKRIEMGQINTITGLKEVWSVNYKEKDVKEFIRQLKEIGERKINEHTCDIGEDLLIIKLKDLDKLAGEKLNG